MEMRLLSAALEDEIEAAQSETLELIKTLCRIPAPSHREERRAAFIREWLEVRGFSAEIDDAKNVRCGWGVEESGEIAVVMAHIDTSQIHAETDIRNLLRVCYSSVNTKD